MANVELFVVHTIVTEYAENINHIQRIRGKNLCIYGEHAKSLSARSLTTPRDIKLCISVKNKTNFKIF